MTELYLGIDTETTGFKKSGALIQPGQARVCQMGMILFNEEGRSLAEFCSLVTPDGWEVGEGAQKIHGFSTTDCLTFGLSMAGIMQLYRSLTALAVQHVAHNADFDAGMMEIEQAYYNVNRPTEKRIEIMTPWFCTMKTNTHITGGKWPKLAEALRHFTGREQSAAHDAMGDVRDCRDVFLAARKKAAA